MLSKFFKLNTKATAKLAEEVDEELKKPDPTLDEARAILEPSCGRTDTEDNTKSS